MWSEMDLLIIINFLTDSRFVPETPDFKNVRREMVRYSTKSATKIGHKQRLHASKRRQIRDDIDLMCTSCPNLRKVNLVVHYKFSMMDDSQIQVMENKYSKFCNFIKIFVITLTNLIFRFGNPSFS